MSELTGAPVTARPTYQSLQVLRAVAALLVLASHIRHKVQVFTPDMAQYFQWTDIGLYGIDLFFVISGFIIALTGQERGHGRHAAAYFMGRRFIRILPLYWLATILSLAVWLYNPGWVNSSAPQLTRIPESFLLLPQEGRYLVQAGWTLVYEMYFYMLFAVTLLLGRWQRVLLPALLAGGALAGALWPQVGPESALLPLITSRHLLEFAAGYLLAVHAAGLVGRLKIAGLCMLGLGTAMIVARVWVDDGPLVLAYTYGVPAMLVVSGAVFSEGALRWPEALVELGNASYSLYLSHGFVVAAGAIVWDRMFPNLPVEGTLMFALAMTAASWLVALECYDRFERPVTRALNGWFRKVMDSGRDRGGTFTGPGSVATP